MLYSAYLRVGVLVCQRLEKLIYPSQGVCASVLCLYVWLCLKICLCPCICPYVSVCAFKCVWVCACTARSYVFSLYWCLCLWQQSVRTHICWWRGCWRTLLCMWLFFSMLSLCEFASVYVHTCVYHTCLLSLCLCECVHTCVCGAHAGDIPPQMRETRVPMLEAPLPLFLYCLPATCATCNSPNTNTNKHIHYAHM